MPRIASKDGGPPCHTFSEDLGLVKWGDRWYVTEIKDWRQRGLPTGYGGAFASREHAALHAKHLVDNEGFR